MSTNPAASAVGSVANGVGPPTTVSGIAWIAGFGIFSFVMVMAAESEQYGDIAVALTWLIGLGATVYWWNSFDTNIAQMIGIPPSTTSGTNATTVGTNTPQGTTG
ncbi:MAG: hypothetical protein JWM85_3600 [Acidimicrobiaceae bacterium]|nr:hypothetical protein [Acidimicrobiaceae bacterium]